MIPYLKTMEEVKHNNSWRKLDVVGGMNKLEQHYSHINLFEMGVVVASSTHNKYTIIVVGGFVRLIKHLLALSIWKS